MRSRTVGIEQNPVAVAGLAGRAKGNRRVSLWRQPLMQMRRRDRFQDTLAGAEGRTRHTMPSATGSGSFLAGQLQERANSRLGSFQPANWADDLVCQYSNTTSFLRQSRTSGLCNKLEPLHWSDALSLCHCRVITACSSRLPDSSSSRRSDKY
jgi:hypothetical protein